MANDVYVEQISGKSYSLPKTMNMHPPCAMVYFHIADSHNRTGYCCITAKQEEADPKSGIYYRKSEFGEKLLFALISSDEIIFYRSRTYTILGFDDSPLRDISKALKGGGHSYSTGKNISDSHVYYCRNGEEVLVSLNPSDSKSLIVQYKGKSYERSKDCIGKTLLMDKPTPKPKAESNSSKSNYRYERYYYSGYESYKPAKSTRNSFKPEARRISKKTVASDSCRIRKSCQNCMSYRNGDCIGHKNTCAYFKYAPVISKEETDNWPEYGDATFIRMHGHKRR